MPKPVTKTTWDDALMLWQAFMADQPYGRKLQAWNRLAQVGSVAAGLRPSERINWPDVLLHLTPDDFVRVLEELEGR